MFVAAWPGPGVLERVAALDRPEVAGVRWTTPDQWHVTLRFLGDVEPDAVPELVEALTAVAARHEPVGAAIGPATGRFGTSILHVPVTGLDAMAAAVVAATTGYGSAPMERRSFHGHLTLARAGGRTAQIPATWADQPISGTWTVDALTLVASETHTRGARYRRMAVAPLGGDRHRGPAGDDHQRDGAAAGGSGAPRARTRQGSRR